MMLTDCDHNSVLDEWRATHPAIYEHLEEIHYETKNNKITDIDGNELKEWIANFDAKQFPRKAEETIASAIGLEERFLKEADKWQRETGHISSPNKRAMHPSYQAILGMGADVVPYLIHDLRNNRRPWFGALSYLTTENPIRREDVGKMDSMIEAWLSWAKSRGIA